VSGSDYEWSPQRQVVGEIRAERSNGDYQVIYFEKSDANEVIRTLFDSADLACCTKEKGQHRLRCWPLQAVLLGKPVLASKRGFSTLGNRLHFRSHLRCRRCRRYPYLRPQKSPLLLQVCQF
jgi:hypothetical protein